MIGIYPLLICLVLLTLAGAGVGIKLEGTPSLSRSGVRRAIGSRFGNRAKGDAGRDGGSIDDDGGRGTSWTIGFLLRAAGAFVHLRYDAIDSEYQRRGIATSVMPALTGAVGVAVRRSLVPGI